MKEPIIVLHPGPHKTGTTSIQHMLREQFGNNRVKDIWYPTHVNHGPGHAELAWSIAEMNGRKNGFFELGNIIDFAKLNNVKAIILSAEDLCHCTEETLKNLRQYIGGIDIHLFFTMNAIGKRTISLWQEMVKHGHDIPLDESGEFVFRQPSINPYLLQKFIDNIEPKKIAIVTSNYNDHNMALYDRFLRALYDSLGQNDTVLGNICIKNQKVYNKSLGYQEADTLCIFNTYIKHNLQSNIDYEYVRNLILALFSSDLWRLHVENVPLQIPSEWNNQIEECKRETIKIVQQLQVEKNIEIYGDLNDIDDNHGSFSGRSHQENQLNDMQSKAYRQETKLLNFVYIFLALYETQCSRNSVENQSRGKQVCTNVCLSNDSSEVRRGESFGKARGLELHRSFSAQKIKILARSWRKAISINGVRRLLRL